MILIELDNKTACVNQLHVYKSGDCHNTWALHLKDEQSGFYECLEFKHSEDERDRVFNYVTGMIREYVTYDRIFISIEVKRKNKGE